MVNSDAIEEYYKEIVNYRQRVLKGDFICSVSGFFTLCKKFFIAFENRDLELFIKFQRFKG